MDIKYMAMMIMGIIKEAGRQVWLANSSGELEYADCMLTINGNKKSGAEPQRVPKESEESKLDSSL